MPEVGESASGLGAEVMPHQEGREIKPDFKGRARLEVAVDSGAAISVILERLLEGHRVVPSEGSRKG
eukprot:5103665-Alexandrium_andersonii.AAC.1